MSGQTQFAIIEEIVLKTAYKLDAGWHEFIVDYYVEGSQSAVLKTVLTSRDGELVESPIGSVVDIDKLMRELKGSVSSENTGFTRCRIHVFSDGRYETSYGYDAVDWGVLLEPEWNFPQALVKA